VGRRGVTGGARGAVRRTSPITKVRVNIYVPALTGYACAIATSQMVCRPWQGKGRACRRWSRVSPMCNGHTVLHRGALDVP